VAVNAQYTDLKAAWHTDKIAQLREGKQPTPAQVQLIISDLCNESCSFCAYRMEGYSSNQHFGEKGLDGFINNNPNRMIPYDKALEILDDMAALGIRAVQFTGGGEPTVHPRALDLFRHALDLRLECALVTNGTLFRDGWESVLPRFSWIRVSLDAGTADTYASMRRVKPSMFHRVLANLKSLNEAVDDQGTACTVGTSFIVTKENYQEIGLAADLVKEAGTPSIRYSAIFTPELAEYYSATLREEATRRIRVAQNWVVADDFTVIDMFTDRLGDLRQGRPDYEFCGYQHFNVYIGGDLNVYRCCNTAYNDLGRVGSLKDQRFADYWYSEQKKQAYGEFDARACQHCAFNRQNRTINYMVQDKPLHISFV
jgi:MoaA/NifB/PqqE/SkfB family radical SAM enzyme